MDNNLCVKINLYDGYYVEDVIYFRYNVPLPIVERWKWYFDFLAAKVKVKNPQRKVEVVITACNIPCGEDYVSEHAKNFLRAKKVKLKRLKNNRYVDDLFGWAKDDYDESVAAVNKEIQSLERGEFNYYYPVAYINKIKDWI